MKHRRMGGIIIGTENTSRGKNFNRRFFVFHNMNLSCRCLGTQKEFRREVEGILHISCRVVLRRIQCGKVVVIGLNLSSLVYLKAHSCKDIDELFPNQGNRVKVSDGYLFCRQCEVDFFRLIFLLQLALFHLLFHFLELAKRPLF